LRVQAALLDAGCAAVLGQLLARLVPGAADPAKGAEARALTTMALEIATVLCNPDVCLDPSLSLEQRAVDECVGASEVRIAIHCVAERCITHTSAHNQGICRPLPWR